MSDVKGKPGWTAPEDFGPELRLRRAEAGLSLRAAAAQVKISYSYLSLLESGKVTRAPDPVVVTGLAELYEVNAEDLFRLGGLVPAGLFLDFMKAAGVSPEAFLTDFVREPTGFENTRIDSGTNAADAFDEVLKAFAASSGMPEPPRSSFFGDWHRDFVLRLLAWAVSDRGRQEVVGILSGSSSPTQSLHHESPESEGGR